MYALVSTRLTAKNIGSQGHAREDPLTPPKKTARVNEEASSPHVGQSAQHKLPWRNYRSIAEFIEAAGLDPNITFFNKPSSTDFPQWLLGEASDFMTVIQSLLKTFNYTDIPDITFPPKGDTDQFVSTYVELLKVHSLPSPNRSVLQSHQRVLKRCASATPPVDDKKLLPFKVIKAFHREPADGRNIAGSIYHQITKFFNEYNSLEYLSPYTSIVGPSGIGKSFIVQQLARQNYSYVIYTSLCQRDSRAYPGRSVIADRLLNFFDRSDMTLYYECFVAASLSNVAICREMGLSPRVFFDLQVLPEFTEFQKLLTAEVNALYENAKTQDGAYRKKDGRRERSDPDGDDFEYQGHINKFIPAYKSRMSQHFKTIYEKLLGTREFGELVTRSGDIPRESQNKPSAVVCFDEARALLKSSAIPPEMPFLSLRRALRHQSKNGRDTDEKRIFGLLLDTTSQISDFQPPLDRDQSAKYLRPTELFPPLYRLDSIDVFAAGMTNLRLSQCIDADVLFKYGRPLWAAPLTTNVKETLGLAKVKVQGGWQREIVSAQGMVFGLALLSYRVHFYVAQHNLAEELVSGFLRYIVDVSDDRKFLRTLQPSEPILAYTSAIEMWKKPSLREYAMKSLYESTVNGTIHLGDIGDIVAALLLLFTFDKIHSTRLPTPIKISDFMTTLLSGDRPLGLGKCMEQNAATRKLWTDGVVFFNHFVRTTEKPTLGTLQQAYRRGAAIFPPTGYKGCDAIIPVLIPQEEAMTYIVIQVKNRRDDDLSHGLRNEARYALDSAAKHLPSSQAHIALMMSLRGKLSRGEVDIIYPPLDLRSEGAGQGQPATISKRTPRSRRRGNRKGIPGQPTPQSSDSGFLRAPKYIWNDGAKVVLAAVGLDTDIYPGLRFRDGSESEPQETQRVVDYMQRLLDCTSEFAFASQDPYYKHLATLG